MEQHSGTPHDTWLASDTMEASINVCTFSGMLLNVVVGVVLLHHRFARTVLNNSSTANVQKDGGNFFFLFSLGFRNG